MGSYVEKRDELVTLRREDLFAFLGQMALPPWRDRDGKWIGSRIDCAPIAQEIIEWVNEHEVSG